jgi:hypothetical protein
MSAILAKLGTEIASSLAPLVVAAILWAIKQGTDWLKSKTKNEQVQGALDIANDVTMTVVMALQQTMAGPLKAAASDGKLTDDEKTQLKRAAIDALKQAYGESGLKELQKILGLGEDALMSFLVAKLEAAVLNIK